MGWSYKGGCCMRPLNILKNINHSRKNFLPIIVILAIQICLLVYIISLGVSLLYEMDYCFYNCCSCIASVTPNNTFTNERKQFLKSEVEQIPGVINVIEGTSDHASAKLIFFGSDTRLVTVKRDNLNDIMKVLNISLNSGRMPENQNEILLSDIAINAALSFGAVAAKAPAAGAITEITIANATTKDNFLKKLFFIFLLPP
jgi:hypothetical protein